MGTEISPWPFLVLAVAMALASSSLLYRRYPNSPIRPKQLGAGYAVLCMVCAATAAYETFAPPISLYSTNYPYSAFWFTFCILTFVCGAGTALVGAPLVFFLSQRGLGTVPAILLASVPVSLCAAALATTASPMAPLGYWQKAAFLVPFHGFAALCFAIAAGAPWSSHRTKNGT